MSCLLDLNLFYSRNVVYSNLSSAQLGGVPGSPQHRARLSARARATCPDTDLHIGSVGASLDHLETQHKDRKSRKAQVRG